MTLTLRIINGADLELGASPELVLNNRGANIGRALTSEWVLPDDSCMVSRRHCEVQFRENAYYIIDYGTPNGTFVGTSEQPLAGAHRIAPGDRFRIGPYVIEARLAGAPVQQHQAEQAQAAAAGARPGFSEWDNVPGLTPPPPPPPAPGAHEFGGWDLPKAAPDRASVWSEEVSRDTGGPTADDIFGSFTAKNEVDWNHASWTVDPDFDPFAPPREDDGGFAPLSGDPSPAPATGGGFAPLPGQPQPASPPAPTGGGAFAPLPGSGSGSGGGFAPLPGAVTEPAPPAVAPFPASNGAFKPLDPAQPPVPPEPWPGEPSPDSAAGAWSPGVPPPPAPPPYAPPREDTAYPAPPPVRVRPSPVAAPVAAPVAPQPDAAVPPATPTPAARPDAVFAALLHELGVPASQLKLSPEETAAKTGRMLRHLIAGLMILLEARARAKEEMGAAGTALSFDGNNPLKFARNVDQALAMMLNPQLRGYMEAENGIEEAYRDLQAHQIATLKAMQGALRETLNRFSPAAIKARTKQDGLLAKVMPGQREAALWKAYEAQFSGVAEGSAEAFLEVFSREFRKAYEEANRRPR
jgi:type VI secretion system FHA domain protein